MMSFHSRVLRNSKRRVEDEILFVDLQEEVERGSFGFFWGDDSYPGVLCKLQKEAKAKACKGAMVSVLGKMEWIITWSKDGRNIHIDGVSDEERALIK